MTAIKKFTIALALMAMAPFAAAQNPNVPVGLDLNGIWELDERGERQDTNNPLVRIEHTGYTVTAKFLTGAECFDGTKRTVVFVGALSFAVPGGDATLSSNNMPVCSGSSSVVKKCGGSIPAMYQSNFTGVTLTPDLNTGGPNLIMGQRYAQGYDGCKPDSSSDGTHPFTLERRSPCAVEERKVKNREQALVDLLGSITGAREPFRVAIEVARQRYGPMYHGQPTETLTYPHGYVDGDYEMVVGNAESLFGEMPDVLASAEWARAREMALDMALVDRLPALVRMHQEIERIEKTAPDARNALRWLHDARRDLEACKRAHP